MQVRENSIILTQDLSDPTDQMTLQEACGTAPSNPLEFFLLSWDQFVNELEFE
jgi:hypothetical protein